MPKHSSEFRVRADLHFLEVGVEEAHGYQLEDYLCERDSGDKEIDGIKKRFKKGQGYHGDLQGWKFLNFHYYKSEEDVPENLEQGVDDVRDVKEAPERV